MYHIITEDLSSTSTVKILCAIKNRKKVIFKILILPISSPETWNEAEELDFRSIDYWPWNYTNGKTG